jgi:prophage regulatory protein
MGARNKRPHRFDPELIRFRDILSKAEIEILTGLSRASIDRMRAAGSFPRPIQISARRIAWRSEDVYAWLEKRPHAAVRTVSDDHIADTANARNKH